MAHPASQLLLLGVPGPDLTAADEALFRRHQPGGFVLRAHNLVSLQQTRRLTDALRALSDIEPFLCVDSDDSALWGAAGNGHRPPCADELRLKDSPPLIAQHGWITGRFLRLLGCNLNLAPVLDIGIRPDAPGTQRERCWGHDDQEVINHAGTFNRYQRRQGILGCGKHFPGGAARTAPADRPVIDFAIDELLRSDLLPYTALMPELDAVIASHHHFPKIDPGHPASLSRRIITGLLRDQLGYQGLVIHAPRDRNTIADSGADPPSPHLAAEAGSDLLIHSGHPEAVPDTLATLGNLSGYALGDILTRIERTKKRLCKPTKLTPKVIGKLTEALAKLRAEVSG